MRAAQARERVSGGDRGSTRLAHMQASGPEGVCSLLGAQEEVTPHANLLDRLQIPGLRTVWAIRTLVSDSSEQSAGRVRLHAAQRAPRGSNDQLRPPTVLPG
jgi:hypothetical protein